jgi:hypothetical protein
MFPHEAAGGCTPIPRKLKEASCRIEDAVLKVAVMITGGMAFGSIYRVIILELRAPLARADSTYSFSFMDSTLA